MTDKNIIKNIKDKEMDRKDFLKYSGLVILSIIGFKALISVLEQSENGRLSLFDRSKISRGFGGGKYGA